MYYYDWPTHFAASIEDQIVAAVESLLPEKYQAARDKPQAEWGSQIDKLTDTAGKQPPLGGIVFIGSSSIRRWDLKASFPALPVVNHGFGGSQFCDALYYVDRLVKNYQPRTVVIYSGDNDINAGKSPEQVAADGIATIMAVRRAVPEARILALTIKPSPKRWSQVARQRQANAILENYVQTSGDRKLFLVDVATPLLGSDGLPRPDCYVEDRLHMTGAGYALWTEKLLPYLVDEQSTEAKK